MHAFTKFILVVLTFCFLPLMPLQAVAAVSPTPIPLKDGNPPKKRKVVRKKVVKASVTSANPTIDIYISGGQAVISVKYQNLTTQTIRQVGDQFIVIQKDGKFGTTFDNSKDQQIVDTIVKKFKTKEAFFISVPSSLQRPSLNTIALNKDDWSGFDINELRKLIESFFAPVQVNYTPIIVGPKSFVMPPSTVGISTSSR